MSLSSAANKSPTEPARRRPPQPTIIPAAAGSALVVTLLFIAVLSLVAGSLMWMASTRYSATFHGASWQEAMVAAEAGVDVAMSELRKRVTQGPTSAFAYNWTTKNLSTGIRYADNGRAFPGSGPDPCPLPQTGGEGNTRMNIRVYVDVPGSGAAPLYTNFAVQPPKAGAATYDSYFLSQVDDPNLRDPDGVDRSRWWYRIRSVGTAGLSGPVRPSMDKRDNTLRRLSLFTDWRTNQAVSSPQVSRMVETIAKPLTGFRNAIMADKRIDLTSQDVLIDSYDSTKGPWDPNTNRGTMGNLATNGKLINAGGAEVLGDAATNDGSVNDADRVSGQQRADFYQELLPITAASLQSTWATIPSLGTLYTDAFCTASTDKLNPTRIKVNGINLPSGGHVIKVNAPPPPKGSSTPPPSYIKVYVDGDLITRGTSCIEVDQGVNAMVYVTGNVDLQGTGMLNDSGVPGFLLINGVQPPANADGTYPTRTINIATTQDFSGIVYAPNHDLTLALQVVTPSGTPTVSATLPTLPTPPVSPAPPGLPPAPPIPDPIQKQIDDLTKKAADFDKKYADAMKKYNDDLAKYNQSGKQSDSDNAQKDLQKAQDAQAQGDALRKQLAALTAPYAVAKNDHASGYNGVYGAFVANTITVGSKTHVHYDETLRQAGPVNHYQIVSWFEDTLVHSTKDTPAFWW